MSNNLIKKIFILVALCLPIAKLINNNYNYFDFGIYLKNVYHLSENWKYLFDGHIQPAMLFYSGCLKFIPNNYMPYLMIATQSLGVIYAAKIIEKNFGQMTCLLFIFYIPTWSLLLIDFHYEFLILIFTLKFYESIENKRLIRSFIWISLSILVKEVYSLLIISSGIFYLLISQDNKYSKEKYQAKIIGIIAISFGLIYFYISNAILIPHFNPGNLDFGFKSTAIFGGSISIESLATRGNNFELLISSFGVNFKEKLRFLFLITYPILFFRDKEGLKYLILTLPFLLIAFLSSLNNHQSIHTHYVAAFIVPVIISVGNLDKKFILNKSYLIKTYVAYIILMNVIFSISPISRLFWSNRVYDFSINSYMTNIKSKKIEKFMCDGFNKDNIYIVQNNVNLLCLSQSENYFTFPSGLSNGLDNKKDTYVLLGENMPLFVDDKGCTYIDSKCMDSETVSNYYFYKDFYMNNFTKVIHINGITIYKSQ